jgi:predicted amidophosphoribosyltransferase
MSRTRQVGLCANCDKKMSPGEKVLGLAFCSTCTNPTVEEAVALPKPKPLGRLADLGLAIAIVAVVVLGVVAFGGGA